jgi:methyl-accepting chemotaxis protein
MARETIASRRILLDGGESAGPAILDVPSAPARKAQAKHRLEEEIARIASALQQGRLEERVRTDLFQGSDQTIAGGVNSMLEALIQPLKMSAKYMQRIGQGDIPPKITQTYSGDFNEIKNGANGCIDSLTAFIAEMKHMSDEHDKGDIDVTIPAGKFEGAYRVMAQRVNDMVAGHIAVKKKAMACVAEFAKGNFEAPLEKFPGKKSFINDTIERLRTNIQSLIAQMKHMSDEHNKGDIDVTIPAAKFDGSFRVMAEGVNGMVAGHITVKKKAMACVAEFAKGNFDAPLEQFPGKKAFINDTIERLRSNFLSFIADMKHMSDEHNLGDIDVVIPVEKFEGSFRVMAQGVNDMVLGHVAVKKKAMLCIAEFGKGNFKAALEKFPGKKAFINDTIELMRTSLIGLISDTSQNASALASASDELTAVSQQMAGTAEETANQATIVSAASEQVSKNVSSVASASEEMQASIREISKNASEAARVSRNAVTMASSANDTVKKLGDSSQEIGNVIKVITSIAQQTNLLALNATIEAARAGEAGKGFAVVANEVKELAKQTARATGEIGEKIGAIQTDTHGAVKAIEDISTIISQINDISNSIASAVEEQTVTTNEIGRSVTEASQGVNDIAQNITGVAVAAKNTTQGANETQKASQELSRMASRLQMTVSKFTY